MSVCNLYVDPTPTTATISIYCTGFQETDCAGTLGCARVNKGCTHFTGCTPFKFTTFEECQAISTQCLTDGIHCVPKDSCSTYKQSKSCTELGLKQVCYWDEIAKTCSDADTCEKLPKSYTTDAQCRDQTTGKKTCTTNGQGCVTSGNNCADQTTEISCFWDLNKNKACFWDRTRTDSKFCQEKICDNAPTSLKTHSACQSFLPDKTCTVKNDLKGCRTITTCGDATTQEGCIINNQNKSCYWQSDKSACVELTCSIAPTSYDTNTRCDGFAPKQNCITKSGGGCVPNGDCKAATTKDSCKMNIYSQTCFWDDSTATPVCREFICENLPTTLTKASDCSAQITTCTLNPTTNKGCVKKTCANAPTDTTNCESYFSQNHCIKNKSGGCNTLTNCSSITLETLCTKDINNNNCYWSPDSSTCVDLKCENLSTSLTKHEDCNGKLPTCTNKSGGGCQTQTCENSSTQAMCNSTTCKWKGDICFEKTCSIAGKSTHQDCNQYLNTCTFNLDKNATTGCALIPLRCDIILNEEACKLKKVVAADGTVTYANCGWDGTKCIDAGCTTLSKQYTTTAACQADVAAATFVNCVSANPDAQGNAIAGCIALPTSCSDRKSQDNCERRFGGAGAYCVWDLTATPKKCVDKSCSTASLTGTTGAITTGNFSNTNCSQYVTGCIGNNTADGCIPQANTCADITVQANCLDGAKKTGDCVWKTSCVDKTCDNLSLNTHNGCYTVTNLSKKCTVNANDNGCQDLKNNCGDYTTQNQCQVTLGGKNCVFNSANKCVDATCADVKDSADFNTFSECNGYVNTCTVLPWLSTCQPKAANCSDYLIEGACKTTSTGDACLWGGKACYPLSTFDCTKIFISGTYDLTKCEGVYYKCKNDSTSGCKAKECLDYTKTTGTSSGSAVSTKDHCSNLDATCTINAAGNACQEIQASCSLYGQTSCSVASTDGTCVYNADVTKCAKAGQACTNYQGATDTICGKYRDFCKADGSNSPTKPCVAQSCEDFFDLSSYQLTHDKCQAHDSTCTAYSDGSQCFPALSTCEPYLYVENCTYNSSGKKCFWDTSTCITLSGSTCTKITGKTNLKRSDCQAYDTTCTVNRAGTACVEIKSTCADPTVAIGDCQESTAGLCVQNQAADSGAKCANPVANTACTSIYVAAGTYTHEICTQLNPLCTNDSTTACKARTCDNATSKGSFSDCQKWLSSCTFNGVSACVAIKATCAEQGSGQCYRATEGECVVSGSNCVQFTDCANKSTPTDNDDCLKYSSTCAIAPIGGCQGMKDACANYKTSFQCVKSTSKDCYWNATAKTCVEFTCANIEQTASFSSNSYCATISNSNSVSIKCTIRSNADNTGVVNGCTDLQDLCTSYKIQQQCVNDKNNKPCEWVTVDSKSSCVYKSCSTASNDYTTDTACKNYYTADTNVKCTVSAVKDDGADTYTLKGCMQRAACTDYKHKDQCLISDKNDTCDWNGTKCDIKSCATADPTNFTDHTGCQGYFSNKCTVTDTDAGCMDLPATCEELNTVNNCKINKAGSECYWQTDNKKCVTPTCANAPQSVITDKKCGDYLDICTQDSDIPCKTLVCEDFTESTDDACKSKLPNNACTTDGTKCVKRGQCKAALVAAACTFNSTSGYCQWDSTNNYCVDMNCQTAPVDKYTTDTQCAAYYIAKKCMSKVGGGCTDRTICTNIKTQDACTNSIGDVYGTLCSWDNGNCRYQNCTDFPGTTHADCQNKFTKGTCTAGASSNCAAMNTCTNTTIQAACVKGTDGPCLWVSGRCYPYIKCQSISFSSDPLCKVISSNCSVDTVLNKCVPITTCSESNINGGCVTGYDGECIISKNDAGKICKVKQSCADAAFQTHQECQDANSGCTTDGTNCIELADCSTYKQQGCKINKAGASDTVTGRCNWDDTAKSCHDETCSEITTGVITTHSGCQQQLKKCSSNGTKCVDLTTCDKYEVADVPCNSAKGTDQLPCFYEAASATNNNVASCRTKKCSDITDLTLCSISGLSCVSDGTKCIVKGTCSSYNNITKTACNAGGTDGVCVWKAGATAATGTCSKVNSCTDADQDACSNAALKSVCYWKSTTTGTTTTSACAPHTCASYKSYNNGNCASFLVYGEATQQICAVDANSVCIETDPTKLPSGTCFSSSNYVYTWNTQGNTCQSCKSGSVQIGNNSSNGNGTNGTTDSGYILGFASIIIGYALF